MLFHQPTASGQGFRIAPELTKPIFRKQVPLIRNRSEAAAFVVGFEREPATGEAWGEGDADATSSATVVRASLTALGRTSRASAATIGTATFAPRGNDIPGAPLLIVIVSEVAMGAHDIQRSALIVPWKTGYSPLEVANE